MTPALVTLILFLVFLASCILVDMAVENQGGTVGARVLMVSIWVGLVLGFAVAVAW